MSNIKTVNLTGTEISVGISGCNCAVRNDGTEIAYVSVQPDVIAGADGVLSVPAGGSAVLLGHNGTVYLLGTGSMQLIGSDYCENPFKSVSTNSSGSGADEVARAAISAHSGNTELHVSVEEKAQWNAKADSSDCYINFSHGSAATDALGYLQHGVHKCTNWLNLPEGIPHQQGLVIALNYSSSVADIGFTKRIYISPNQDGIIWQNNSRSGVWSGWTKLSDGGNADTLDGCHAADFVLLTEYTALAERVAVLEQA